MQRLDYRFNLAKKSNKVAEAILSPSAYDAALEAAERMKHQIDKQVSEWKAEVEMGNTLFGMVLAEGHPEIVTYAFNETETLPVFSWSATPEQDPEMKAQAMQAEAEKSGKTPAQVAMQMKLAGLGKSAFGEVPTHIPKTYAQLEAEEAAKAQWDYQERRLLAEAQIEASRRAAGFGGIPKLEPRTPDGPKVFPATTTMIFNIRAVSANGRLTSAFDVKVVGHAEFAPANFIGNTAQIQTLIATGEIGEWIEQGAGLFKVFKKDAALAAIGKLMQALDGRNLKIRSWYETNHGGVAFNVTDE